MSKSDCHGNPDVPRMHEEECPDCGAEVEIWSDEEEVTRTPRGSACKT